MLTVTNYFYSVTGQHWCGVIKNIKLKIYKVYQYINVLINMNKYK